jgi:hypothetical protein
LPVGSFAVLADDHPHWQPDHFGYEVGGSRLYLEFPVVKLLHYSEQMDALLASDNAFALVTAAHLKTRATRGKSHERFDAKYTLMRTLLTKGWSGERIRPLLKVLDWMLYLPTELDRQLWQDIQQSEGEMLWLMSVVLNVLGLRKGFCRALCKANRGCLENYWNAVLVCCPPGFWTKSVALPQMIWSAGLRRFSLNQAWRLFSTIAQCIE